MTTALISCTYMMSPPLKAQSLESWIGEQERVQEQDTYQEDSAHKLHRDRDLCARDLPGFILCLFICRSVTSFNVF